MTADADRWNHNIHYHPLVLASVRAGARDARDVGCGEGMLARRLAERVPRVVGIDTDAASIDAARAGSVDAGIDYVLGDFLDDRFEPSSFDVVASVATIHHLDAETALRGMARLLRLGGTLVIVGLARSSGPVDLVREIAGVIAHRLLSSRRSHWDHPSPTVWPPAETYAGMRRLSARVLPGSRFRRHLLWRYSIVWTRPVDA